MCLRNKKGVHLTMKIIYFAGGCFWGVQRFFDQFDGVLETTVGYANGKTANPTYQDVKSQESEKQKEEWSLGSGAYTFVYNRVEDTWEQMK